MDISEISMNLVTLVTIIVFLIPLSIKVGRNDKKKEDDIKSLLATTDRHAAKLDSLCTNDMHNNVVMNVNNLRKDIIDIYESRNKTDQEIVSVQKDIENIRVSLNKQEISSAETTKILNEMQITLALIAKTLKDHV